MYKQDLGLNNIQWLIYLKIKPNQIKPSSVGEDHPKKGVMSMTLNWILCRGFSPGDLGSVEYLFIVIIRKSTLTQMARTIYGVNRSTKNYLYWCAKKNTKNKQQTNKKQKSLKKTTIQKM